jgi:chondroitin-sulfate-ABC endolyase/exolyase
MSRHRSHDEHFNSKREMSESRLPDDLKENQRRRWRGSRVAAGNSTTRRPTKNRLVKFFLLTAFALHSPVLSSIAAAEVPAADINTVTQRYRDWVLAGPEVVFTNRHVAERYELLKRQARRTISSLKNDIDFDQPVGFYDTRRTGPDQKEVDLLIKYALPHLAIAYQLRGPKDDPNPYFHDDEVLSLLMTVFDRLHQRGFREGMLMPWKSREVEGEVSDKAVIVDFHLRTSGSALAAFLMSDELKSSGLLERTLRTCRDVLSHGEKFGDPNGLKQNADGVRMAINFTLPYALAARDAARLELLTRQIDRSMAVESNAADTIKPDGLGFHHRGVYLSGYAGFTVAQSAFVAWLFDSTELARSPQTIANVSECMAVLRIVSHKYDMHKALAGRLREINVIPHVMMAYGFLAAIEHPRRDEFAGMLARLADDDFMNGPDARQAFSPQRNEVPPGPGGIDLFLKTLAKANKLGAEAPPSGHWALNYGPLSVHRRDNWMVSVKGHSRYLWAFERSLTDARLDERMQNVLGFHDSSASISIHLSGEPISSLGSGYGGDGWDWCRIPGATTRLIPVDELLEIDRSSDGKPLNRPFGNSTFVGGVGLDQRHGVFAMQSREVAPDRRRDGLRAIKAMFFFDDQILVITRGINNGDGKHGAGTTLFQCRLKDAETPTWIRGDKITGFETTRRFDDGKSLTLVDPAGNGYYVPRAENVVVRRARQQSLDYTATKRAQGDFATAWFDHGVSPESDECHYVILVGSGQKRLDRFAEIADQTYSVVQRNSRAIIVRHQKLGLTGYVLPRADAEIEKGMISRVNSPCLVMTERRCDDRLTMSICNPDLGWEAGKQFDFRDKDGYQPPAEPVPMPVTLKLRGAWKLDMPCPDVKLTSTTANSTEVIVATSDARSIQFQLREIR